MTDLQRLLQALEHWGREMEKRLAAIPRVTPVYRGSLLCQFADSWHPWPQDKPENPGYYLTYQPQAGGPPESSHRTLAIRSYELSQTQCPWGVSPCGITHWMGLPEPPNQASLE